MSTQLRNRSNRNRQRTHQNGIIKENQQNNNIPSTNNAHAIKSPNTHERHYVNPLDNLFPFFYTTHSLIALILILAPLFYISIMNPTTERILTFSASELSYTLKLLIGFCLFFYFIIAAMICPSGPFDRPHQLIWRIVFAASLLYSFLLIILLILHPDDSRQFLALFDPSLGKPIKLPLYAEDCTFNWINFSSKLDRFVLVHFLGWFAKGLLIRHRLLLWSMSILWELIEISTYYYIPNFAECWWDQWLLDVLICNGLGIELGLYACKYFEYKNYEEICGLVQPGNIYNKWCSGQWVKLFQPKTWTKVKWEAGRSIQRFIQVLFIILCQNLADMNAFLLKLYLWIPTQHLWNLYRIILLFLMTVPAIRQYYFYVTKPDINRMGSQLFILLVNITLETMLVYKTAPNNIPSPPIENKIGWGISLILFCMFTFLIIQKVEDRDDSQNQSTQRNNQRNNQ